MNEETYTGFIEFTRRNCGEDFLKAFGAGLINVQVYDVAGSEGSGFTKPSIGTYLYNGYDNSIKGLYSLVGQRGFYFKNSKGYDGLGGATIQVTKNFKTLGLGFHNQMIHKISFYSENKLKTLYK